MSDDYQISAIALIAALMLAFAYLHLRFRSVRTLLWIMALICAEVQAILVLLVSHTSLAAAVLGLPASPSVIWMNVAAESFVMLSSVLFLGSLSPLSFRYGQRRVLFAIPYVIPLLIYSGLYYGITQHPTGPLLWCFYFLAVWVAFVAFIWSSQKGATPIWVSVALVGLGGFACIPFFARGDVYWPMRVVESGNMLMTALMVIYNFRRFSPGVFLAVGGFAAWAVPPFLLPYFLSKPPDSSAGTLGLLLIRIIILGKVFVAVSLILLVLEDELEKNQIAQQREHRVRLELEAYAREAMIARSVEEFDRSGNQLCSLIVDQSHFSGAAILVRSALGSYTLVGYAGIDGATAGALDALAQRLAPESLSYALADKTVTPAIWPTPLVPDTASIDLDLTPWLIPGDDLERLHLTRVGAVPMLAPDGSAEGAVLLIGPRVPIETLRADDLLPLEIFAGRLQAARAQSLMLGKLIESERFAGVGQLATNVAQQLNNPLTVILGYSNLLEESAGVGPERRAAESIAIESRRMKGILERLSKFSHLTSQQFTSFSIADLVADIEQFHRTEFLKHSIEFRLTMQPELPQVFGNTHQIRQALLHAMQFAIDSVARPAPETEKAIHIEVTSETAPSEALFVRIVIAHTGHGLPYPERAFDSLSSGFSGTEATGLGLSLCAAIVREHHGNISAVNHEPTGAAIILELPTTMPNS